MPTTLTGKQLLFQQKQDHGLEFRPHDGYSKIVYARMKQKGLDQLIDTMRYDNAFLVRQADVDEIVRLCDSGELPLARLDVMLGKYSYSGDRMPFNGSRLLSDQELEIVGQAAAFEMGCPVIPQGRKAFKVLSLINVTGNLGYLLKVMLDNRAYPPNESHAHQVEGLAYNNQEITVQLQRFTDSEQGWKL